MSVFVCKLTDILVVAMVQGFPPKLLYGVILTFAHGRRKKMNIRNATVNARKSSDISYRFYLSHLSSVSIARRPSEHAAL